MDNVREALAKHKTPIIPDKDMKIFQLSFDCTYITLYAKDRLDAIQVFRESDNGVEVFLKGKDAYIKWDENHDEKVNIEEVPMKRGIIQYESH